MGDGKKDSSGSSNGELSTFGNAAKNLSRSPLQIIALFIVLVYGFAALVVGAKAVTHGEVNAAPLTWFLVAFPVLVLAVFTYLVVRHHRKLYGPGDFRDDEAFLVLIRDTVPAEVRQLPKAQTQYEQPDAELPEPAILSEVVSSGVAASADADGVGPS